MNSQFEVPLVNQLRQLALNCDAPFYAPGHKKGRGASQLLRDFWGDSIFKADLPELPELDNLFAPQGVILQAQSLAAEAFGAERTWFLVNGSTCGIAASILATCGSGDKIILPRNIHQSAIFGLILAGAVPLFLNPEWDTDFALSYCLAPQSIARTLEQHPDTKAVMAVYPTYHGVCGNLEAIADVAHRHDIPLLVDEAHGAHFHFHPQLPVSALEAGADLAVQSTHKVLGAMSQASMLHLRGKRVAPERISQSLQLLQSSSPNYLLLASLDASRQQVATAGEKLLDQTLELAQRARRKLSELNYVSVFNLVKPSQSFQQLDLTRLTVRVTDLGLSGYEADEILHQHFKVTAELPSLSGLTFIISLGNTPSDIARLIEGFEQLGKYQPSEKRTPVKISPFTHTYLASISPREAFWAKQVRVPLEESRGCISTEVICPYPPGIPLLIPGEIITSEIREYLEQVIELGAIITGGSDSTLKTIRVVSNS